MEELSKAEEREERLRRERVMRNLDKLVIEINRIKRRKRMEKEHQISCRNCRWASKKFAPEGYVWCKKPECEKYTFFEFKKPEQKDR